MSLSSHALRAKGRASAGNSGSLFHYSLHFQHSLKLTYLVKTS